MLKDAVTYFQVKDDNLEMVLEDISGNIISVARYPLEILAIEMKPFLDKTANEPKKEKLVAKVYLELIKEPFCNGAEFFTSYKLYHVFQVGEVNDEDGYSFANIRFMDQTVKKVKYTSLFNNENMAVAKANEILNENKKLLVHYYQKVMKQLETIDKSIMNPM